MIPVSKSIVEQNPGKLLACSDGILCQLNVDLCLVLEEDLLRMKLNSHNRVMSMLNSRNDSHTLMLVITKNLEIIVQIFYPLEVFYLEAPVMREIAEFFYSS